MSERRAALLVTVAALAAYATAFAGTFQFDDYAVIVDNPAVHSWSAFAASLPGIRPLLKASYTLSWTTGPQVVAFLAFNVGVHVASALMVLWLARRWLVALAPGLADAGLAALAATLIFALHPAQTEAVTYISGRSVSLMAFFYVASLVGWEGAREGKGAGARASLVLFAAALAVRETAWTLPVAIVLLEWARGRSSARALIAARWHFALLIVALGAILALPAYRDLVAVSLSLRSPWANLAAQVDGVAYLIVGPLLTLRVVIDPEPGMPLFDAQWATRAICLGGLVGAGFTLLRRRPLAGFAILWFFLQLAPTNSFLARHDVANDRHLYLALVGPALLLGGALTALPRGRVAALAVVAIVLGVATALRNTDYRSEIALWEATARAAPGKARVWNNLGYAYQIAGESERARAAYVRAIALDPAEYKARINLELLDAARAVPTGE